MISTWNVLVSRKRSNPERDLVQFRADPEWIDRVNAFAESLGLSMSAFLRLAANEKMQQMNAPPADRKKGRGRRSDN